MLQPARVTVPFLRAGTWIAPGICKARCAVPAPGHCCPAEGRAVLALLLFWGSVPPQPRLLLGCTAPSMAALKLEVFYEFPCPSELSHVCQARCAPLAGDPEASAVLSRVSGTSNFGSCHLKCTHENFRISWKNVDFPPLAEASPGSFLCETVQIQIPHIQVLTECHFSLPSSCVLCARASCQLANFGDKWFVITSSVLLLHC